MLTTGAVLAFAAAASSAQTRTIGRMGLFDIPSPLLDIAEGVPEAARRMTPGSTKKSARSASWRLAR